MRLAMLSVAFLILLLPASTLTTVSRNPGVPASSLQTSPASSVSPSSTAPSITPPTGLIVILRSVFGIAFYNSSGKIVIQPASLFMNMTVKGTNSSGISFNINSGRITIGPSPIVTVPLVFTVVSGQAFLSFWGRLTIMALMTQTYACQPGCLIPNFFYNLFLTGPARLASASNSWSLFTSLFGFLSNSQTKIGLFFVVGITPGDVDEDGRVDIGDLTIVASSFGTDTVQSSMTAPSYSSTGYSRAFYADVNGDGRVDIQDLSLVASSFGQTY